MQERELLPAGAGQRQPAPRDGGAAAEPRGQGAEAAESDTQGDVCPALTPNMPSVSQGKGDVCPALTPNMPSVSQGKGDLCPALTPNMPSVSQGEGDNVCPSLNLACRVCHKVRETTCALL